MNRLHAFALALTFSALGSVSTTWASGKGTPIDTLPISITQAGYYYLTSNLEVTDSTAISVANRDVVIDLCGFRIKGIGNAPKGIAAAVASNVTVMNGTIEDFGTGVDIGNRGRVLDLEVRDCDYGVVVGECSFVERCKLVQIELTALETGPFCVVRDVVAQLETRDEVGAMIGRENDVRSLLVDGGSSAIVGSVNTAFRDCVAFNFDEAGISLSISGSATDCRVLRGPFGTGTVGILLQRNARSVDCTVTLCLTGIVAGDHSTVLRANVNECNTGIVATGPASIENSSVSDSALNGIRADADDVSIDGCRVIDSTADAVLFVGSRGSITDSTVANGSNSGIRLSDHCLASDNRISGFAASGLRCSGDSNRVEDNTLSQNAFGISAASSATHNPFTGNRVMNSLGQDYAIGLQNTIGPLLLTTGWLQGSNPHVNFATPLF